MKILITDYAFDASSKTITFNDYGTISLESVLLVTNVTDNVIIYNFAGAGKGGTVATNVLTLDYDTTSMDDSDELQIYYDDPDKTQSIDDGGDSITVDSPALTSLASTVSGSEIQVDVLTIPDVTVNATDLDIRNLTSTDVVTANLSPTDNAVLDSIDNAVNGTLDVNLASGAQTDSLTDTELRASPVVVDLGANNDVTVTSSTLPSGASTSAKQDTGNASVASIDTKTPALGQALAAASVPVILPSATITALTPPSAMTGFATSAKQDSLLTELQLKADLTETQPVSLASVPSHAVTNAGTFATQASQSGTWTVQPGNTANTTAWKVDGSAVTQPVSASSMPLPTGAATSALQTQPGVDIGDVTINNASGASAVNIQDGGNSITVDQATGTNLHTVIDSGTVTAVTAITNALPTGTNSIGKIGDITTSVTPGTGTANLGKAEDAAHTSGDVGVMALGVRQDSDSSPVNADGDYHAPIFNNIGRMKVSALPGATAATTGNISTGTGTVAADVSHHGGAIFTTTGTFSNFNGTFEASIDNGTTYFGVQVARTTTGIIESTTGVISATPSYAWRVNCSGYTNIRIRATALTSGTVAVTIAPAAFATDNAPSVSLQSGTNNIGSIASIATSIVPGTGATNLGKAEDAAHTSGDTGVMALGVRNDGAATAISSTNGDYTPIATDAAGTVSVAQKSGTATLTNVASSATSVTVLAANTARKAATIYNDSTQVVYIKFGSTASTSSFTVPLLTNTYYEVPGGYTGIIDGIWVSANGNARVTEIT